jgi:choline dehydrogenase-like flavoprotein
MSIWMQRGSAFLGGTTNHWNGYCAPLQPIDFRPRSWVPHSGWPISRQDLEPFYRRAQPICQLGPYAYSAGMWEKLGVEPHAFEASEIELCFWQRSPPTRFGEVYRAELARADNVRVLLHGNVTNIETDPSASVVRHLDVRTLDGKRGQLRAKVYVLACGGIENARLLLLSDSVEPAGLGNRHDLVGRFFMEHPHAEPGVVVTDDARDLTGVYRHYLYEGARLDPSFCAGEAMQEREQVLNSHAFLFAETESGLGVQAGRQLWREVRQRQMPDDLAEKVWAMVRDLDEVAAFGWRVVTDQRPYTSIRSLYFSVRSEQAPNPASRVTLAHERDALGLRRVQLDWQLTDLDKRTVDALTRTLGAEVARLNLGRVRLADWLLDGTPAWPPDMHGGAHHLGTTRMTADPRDGVVDADCRVHGVGNLYIAGSSVFATGGCANPTLTIVALALRFVDHLKVQLT